MRATSACVACRAKHPSAGSIGACQNIPLYRNSDLSYVFAILIREKGRSYVVTSRGSGCGGRGRRRCGTWCAGRVEPRERIAGRARRAALNAYGKTVWSWPSLLRSSLCGGGVASTGAASVNFAKATEARQNSSPGRARISRQPTAQGRPDVSAALSSLLCIACATFSHGSLAGASRHPAFPAPSLIEGAKRPAKLGQNAPREGECVSAV